MHEEAGSEGVYKAIAALAGGSSPPGKSVIFTPFGNVEHVEPVPMTVADVEHSELRDAWQAAMGVEPNDHAITGTFESVIPPPGSL